MLLLSSADIEVPPFFDPCPAGHCGRPLNPD
jgi:hypothetical protein